jgi:putative restriction endonuclease
MRGYIANTDFDWYRTLREQPDLDEVNFWQPSGRRDFKSIPSGAPFFFKLKDPHYAVAGFGFFAHASRLPVSLAWEAFERKNGAEDLEALLNRIRRYRERPVEPHEDPVIGCLMVVEPVFFAEEDWVRQPRDWPRNVVQGKAYDLSQGEGRRVWEECLARARAAGKIRSEVLAIAEPGGVERFGAAIEVRPPVPREPAPQGKMGQRAHLLRTRRPPHPRAGPGGGAARSGVPRMARSHGLPGLGRSPER